MDSDHLSILQWDGSKQYDYLMTRLSAVPRSDMFVTIISFHEQLKGWQSYIHSGKRRPDIVRGYHKLSEIFVDFASMNVLEFSDDVAERFDELRKNGVRIGTMDLRIAATALTRDFTVLTRNFADFEKVPNLKYEDWTVPLTSDEN